MRSGTLPSFLTGWIPSVRRFSGSKLRTSPLRQKLARFPFGPEIPYASVAYLRATRGHKGQYANASRNTAGLR